MVPADLRTRCGPCGAFFESDHAAREHLRTCAAYQPRDAIIMDAPPGGPRGVKWVMISPGVGASPCDDAQGHHHRYFCRVCRDFTGATGDRGDACTINPSHPLRGKKKPGRPSPWGGRPNRARTEYANYLSLLSYLQFVRWWCSHAPEDYVERLTKRENYNLTRVFSERVKWDLNKFASELTFALLARKRRKPKSTVEQLIKEGQWWDRIEEDAEQKHGLEGLLTIRRMTHDRYQEVLEDGRRLLRRTRAQRLTPAQANNLFLRLPPAIDAAIMAHIEAVVEKLARSRRGPARRE